MKNKIESVVRFKLCANLIIKTSYKCNEKYQYLVHDTDYTIFISCKDMTFALHLNSS